MKVHPIADDYADFTPAERSALCADIKANGQVQPIVVWRGEVVDGKHRLAICHELNIEAKTTDITDECPTEEEMRVRVRSLNQHRRSRTVPMSNDEKRRRTVEELAKNPNRSDRAIAEVVGVDHKTVAAQREQVGESPTCSHQRVGRNGWGSKRAIVEAALKANPTKSNNELAVLADVTPRYIIKVRAGLNTPANIAKRASTVAPKKSTSRFADNGQRDGVAHVAAPSDTTTPSRPRTIRSNPIVRAWDNASTGERAAAIGHLRKLGAVR